MILLCFILLFCTLERVLTKWYIPRELNDFAVAEEHFKTSVCTIKFDIERVLETNNLSKMGIWYDYLKNAALKKKKKECSWINLPLGDTS